MGLAKIDRDPRIDPKGGDRVVTAKESPTARLVLRIEGIDRIEVIWRYAGSDTAWRSPLATWQTETATARIVERGT